MHSTIVNDRKAAAEKMLATLDRHGERVGGKLRGIFSPLLEAGEVAPDYVLIQQLISRTLRTKLADLLVSDEAHLALLRRMGEYRQRGVEAAAVVKAKLEDLRCAGGEQRFSELPESGEELPLAGADLEAMATAVLNHHGAGDLELPTRWSSSEGQSWLGGLRAPLKDLRRAIAEQPFLRGRLTKTQAVKWQAMNSFDQVYADFAEFLEALYCLAGEEDVALSLRSRYLETEQESLAAVAELALAEEEPPRRPLEEEDPVQRRIRSRGPVRANWSRWLGTRVFVRRTSSRSR